MKRVKPFAYLLIAVGLYSCNTPQKETSFQKNEPVNFAQVKIEDNFWLPRINKHAEVTLPACLNQCEVETQRIKNFAIAAGMEEGEFKGLVYDDSDLYKMIEGCSYSLMNHPNPELEKKLDEIIDKIAGAQLEDGYLMTYFILGDLNQRWTNMDKHEMYCCGHLIEAAIAYYNATGKRTLLDVAIKFANHIDNTFGKNKRNWVPGHQEIELALVKLYRVTQDDRYLKLAHWLLEQRGHNHGDWKAKDYYQDLKPVSELSKISGHAVRAMYMFTGMADLASITQDTAYVRALDRLWEDVTKTKMYATGGIGSSRKNEGFTEDYDLPNAEAYCETCASVGMVFWNQRMNMLKGDGKYVDILERSMYNGALAGISLSADRFFYVNPLESAGTHHRKPWYGTACCPSQISRFLPSVGNYVYATSSDALWVNLYIASETNVTIEDVPMHVKQLTEYPWKGDVKLVMTPEKETNFTLKVRIPNWCKNYEFMVNGEKVKTEIDKQYLLVERTWKAGDEVSFSMAMPVEVVAADPRVKANIGKRCLQRGPLVYCMEEIDNPLYNNATLLHSTNYMANFEPDLLGGVVSITAVNGDDTYKFIPYYAWDNREAGKMQVWVKYEE
ncbi:glycoside hydrolase family 127 protein [Phocaeicola abscessus]|uniref:glycoside hydrolase family 127 protein n=1 Tax=Phocaeicola abscessus TaxID=555313 RepID=UPI0004B77ABB|nr:beta-L-arabinofuranosidase domain-containing protein [Phocaeicola abscessus]